MCLDYHSMHAACCSFVYIQCSVRLRIHVLHCKCALQQVYKAVATCLTQHQGMCAEIVTV
jgi:hypothetical protein